MEQFRVPPTEVIFEESISLSAPFPDFKQYPRPRQAVVWRRFESSFARISPNFALSQSTHP